MGTCMFKRAHHDRIARLLCRMNARLLDNAGCFFAGGTAIVMSLDEYRESVDIDFVVSSRAGYAAIRVGDAGYLQRCMTDMQFNVGASGLIATLHRQLLLCASRLPNRDEMFQHPRELRLQAVAAAMMSVTYHHGLSQAVPA